jgi:hypothetical protein
MRARSFPPVLFVPRLYIDNSSVVVQSVCNCEKLVAIVIRYIHHRDDKSGRAVQGMKCLRPLKHWSRGFESYWKHGCLCCPEYR